MADIPALDKQIETLMECKPLPETEVKQLCEKVSNIHILLTTLLNSYHLCVGKGNLDSRVECSTSQSASNYLWRHSRTVPRSKGAIQDR